MHSANLVTCCMGDRQFFKYKDRWITSSMLDNWLKESSVGVYRFIPGKGIEFQNEQDLFLFDLRWS